MESAEVKRMQAARPVQRQKPAPPAEPVKPEPRANSRSKEEQLALRKKMMKYNPLEASGMKKTAQTKAISGPSAQEKVNPATESVAQDKGKLPNPELLSRLAKGEKVQVSKQDMHQLTKKNYQNLPEVKKKREEKERIEELRKRVDKQKQFGKELRSRSKQKKETSEAEEEH